MKSLRISRFGTARRHTSSSGSPPQGEIPCHEEYAPQIVRTAVQIPVGQFLVDPLCDAFAVYQHFQLPPGSRLRRLDEAAYDIVSAGVDPESPRRGFRVGSQVGAVIDHVPGAVNVCVAEAVSIVPFLGKVKPVPASVIAKHLLHFPVGKAEMFIELDVHHGEYPQVVQTCKNTL